MVQRLLCCITTIAASRQISRRQEVCRVHTRRIKCCWCCCAAVVFIFAVAVVVVLLLNCGFFGCCFVVVAILKNVFTKLVYYLCDTETRAEEDGTDRQSSLLEAFC